jgi:hypothetical protein
LGPKKQNARIAIMRYKRPINISEEIQKKKKKKRLSLSPQVQFIHSYPISAFKELPMTGPIIIPRDAAISVIANTRDELPCGPNMPGFVSCNSLAASAKDFVISMQISE